MDSLADFIFSLNLGTYGENRRNGGLTGFHGELECVRGYFSSWAAAKQFAEKGRFRRSAPKGATDFGGLTALLKQCPDTDLAFSHAVKRFPDTDLEFFARREAMPLIRISSFSHAVKRCPDTGSSFSHSLKRFPDTRPDFFSSRVKPESKVADA